MCISSITRRMTCSGHGEPAMIPVRSEERSCVGKSGLSSIAMNIVGTPYGEVQRSWATTRRVVAGSNDGAGMTMHVPWVVLPWLPMTMPKQW